MKKFKIIFEIHLDRDRKDYKEIIIEAGNKKVASIRAMYEIGKFQEYSGLFKNIISVEEVEDLGD